MFIFIMCIKYITDTYNLPSSQDKVTAAVVFRHDTQPGWRRVTEYLYHTHSNTASLQRRIMSGVYKQSRCTWGSGGQASLSASV